MEAAHLSRVTAWEGTAVAAGKGGSHVPRTGRARSLGAGVLLPWLWLVGSACPQWESHPPLSVQEGGWGRQGGWGDHIFHCFFCFVQALGMPPFPSARHCFLGGRHWTEGHLRSGGQPQPPLVTISRASSENNLVQKASAHPSTSSLLRGLHILSHSGQIFFFFSTAQTRSHLKCPPRPTSAVPPSSVGSGWPRGSSNRDGQTAPSLWSPGGPPAAHTRAPPAPPDSTQRSTLAAPTCPSSPAAAGPPGTLGHPVWPWFCSFPVFQHLPETQAHYMAPCWFT